MSEHKQTLAMFPGTFDPLTNGHLDIIRRAATIFDRLIVAVGENPDKSSMLSQDERASLIRRCLDGIGNASVETFRGLTVDYARKVGAKVILRGIRNSSDLQSELQLATTNRIVAGIETVFVLTSSEYAFISSSLIKQIAQMGGDVSALVPPPVLEALRNRKG